MCPAPPPEMKLKIRIVKDCGRYAYGILDQLLTASPDRIPVDCPAAGRCGGCSLRHLDYAAELRAKQENVEDAFRRIGRAGPVCAAHTALPRSGPLPQQGAVPGRTGCRRRPLHRFLRRAHPSDHPLPRLQTAARGAERDRTGAVPFFAAHDIAPYDEQTGQGLVRHLFLRRGAHSGQIMVCLVCTRPQLPHSEQLVAELCAKFPAIATILLNVNSKNTNVILGSKTLTLYGPGTIEDTLCGVPVRLGPLSFYQVNTLAAEQLYRTAAQMAQLAPGQLLLDLYCGMGTIGLSMAEQCGSLIGVRSFQRPWTVPKPTPHRWARKWLPRAAFCVQMPVRPPHSWQLRGCTRMWSCWIRPAKAATRRPCPLWCRCPPSGWSM